LARSGFKVDAALASREQVRSYRTFVSLRLLLLSRLQVLHQTLKPHHQTGIALHQDVFVLDSLHERQLLVLRLQRGEAERGIFERDGKRRLRHNTAAAADALTFDDEMPGNLAVKRLQLKRQVFARQLLLERRIVATRAGHQQTQHPQ